ncbi:MAG: deoxyribonuclease IV [Thermoplasmata archaeon]
MIIGGHMSIGGGFSDAPLRARNIGLDAMQVFTKNQRQWIAKPLNMDDVLAYIENIRKFNIKITVAHASYLINLAAPDQEKFQKSVDSMIHELQRCDKLHIPYLIFHPGAHMGEGEKAGLKKIVEGIDKIIEKIDDIRAKITIETTAGQGTNLGYKFEQIGFILDNISDKLKVKICMDTCHVFAAGYELRSKEGYERTMHEFDEKIGFENLVAVHLNDSEKALGSRVDRHAQIGQGYIGREGIGNILKDKRFQSLPLILETPGGEALYSEDLKVIKEIIAGD